jgi:hypothetical protein
MLSTRDTLTLLRQANPDAEVTEHRIRSAIRYGKAKPPATSFSGRFLWTWEELADLAAALRLVAPRPCQSTLGEGASQ